MSYLRKLHKKLGKFFRKSKLKYFWLTGIVLKLPFIRKNFYIKQFVKFVLAGTVSTLIDFAIYVFLTRFFVFCQVHYLWTNFTATIIASIINFLLNKKWTFIGGKKGLLRQYIHFCVVLIGGLAVYQFLFIFFVASLGWHDIIAKVIVGFIIMLVRFHLHKFWVFK